MDNPEHHPASTEGPGGNHHPRIVRLSGNLHERVRIHPADHNRPCYVLDPSHPSAMRWNLVKTART